MEATDAVPLHTTFQSKGDTSMLAVGGVCLPNVARYTSGKYRAVNSLWDEFNLDQYRAGN
jgi:hypothetical protein